MYCLLSLFDSYESMKSLCDRYNKAIDSILQLVSVLFIFQFFSASQRKISINILCLYSFI